MWNHPRVLANLHSLTLDYSYNNLYKVSDTRVQALFAYPNLKSLSLVSRGPSRGSVTEQFRQHLRSLKTVEYLHLDVAGPYHVTRGYLASFPNVKTLSLCHDVDDNGGSAPTVLPEWVGKGCPLDVLADIAYNIAKPFPNLETLIVDQDVPDCSTQTTHLSKLVNLMTAIQDAEKKIVGMQSGWVRRIVIQ